jgi:hypothetical protein
VSGVFRPRLGWRFATSSLVLTAGGLVVVLCRSEPVNFPGFNAEGVLVWTFPSHCDVKGYNILEPWDDCNEEESVAVTDAGNTHSRGMLKYWSFLKAAKAIAKRYGETE